MERIASTHTAPCAYADREPDGYEDLLQSMQQQFETAIERGPLFQTDATGLFNAFLTHLPDEARQHYTCHACRHFVDRFGGLVTISSAGMRRSAFWGGDVPPFFETAIAAIKAILTRSRVCGVFLSSKAPLGTPVTGDWRHMSVTLPETLVHRDRVKTAAQRMSEKAEEFRMLSEALDAYSLPVLRLAVSLLQTDVLFRPETCLGVAEWLLDLQGHRQAATHNQVRDQQLWFAVATAPPGWCHVKSSMIGTLLDDLAAGLPYEQVARRFAEKMSPLQYQRPQAAPAAGNIAQAETLVAQLGVERSLARRFARCDEVRALWRSQEAEHEITPSSGVFSHLRPKEDDAPQIMEIAPVIMTWKKFARTVLPSATSIDYRVDSGPANFSAILTAVHDDAPPILQWDSPEQRNPFSQYVYHSGSWPGKWNLSPGWTRVTAVCLQPSMWFGNHAHQGKSVFFLLEGAKDTGAANVGNTIFPETLRAEFHAIRATIEAYSRAARIAGEHEASACGIRLQAGASWNAVFRVTTNTTRAQYRLDRWD